MLLNSLVHRADKYENIVINVRESRKKQQKIPREKFPQLGKMIDNTFDTRRKAALCVDGQ